MNKMSDAGHILDSCGHDQDLELELTTAPSSACLAVQVHRGWMSPQEVFSHPFSDANEADTRLFQNADLHLPRKCYKDQGRDWSGTFLLL